MLVKTYPDQVKMSDAHARAEAMLIECPTALLLEWVRTRTANMKANIAVINSKISIRKPLLQYTSGTFLINSV